MKTDRSLFEMVASQSQFWREEHEVFTRLIEQVPDRGVTLEIGTADGASAALMHDALKSREISVYSVDKAPSSKAISLLKDTRVKVIKSDSGELAARWADVDGRPLDFLFIDGDHRLEGVYRDFFGWLPYMRENGLVLFHDVDPPARGGVAHLGVRVLVEVLLKQEILLTPCHEFRFLSGRVSTAKTFLPPLSAFYEVFKGILKKAADKTARICGKSLGKVMCSLIDRECDLSSLEACYVLDHLRQTEPLFIDSTNLCRRQLELLDMIDHGFTGADLFSRIETYETPADITALSQAVAREQARLMILADLLSDLVPWSP